MKSFLLKGKKPICRWTKVPHGVFFEGNIPEGYGLGICPNNPYIILDIDVHEDKENGFDHIPENILKILESHFHYKTQNNGIHYWLKYSGNKDLKNKPSGLGIDLRTEKGYVRWYLDGDVRDYIDQIKDTEPELNEFLEGLFLTCSNRR